MTSREIAEKLYERVCGTPDCILTSLDYMIEEGEVDQEFYRVHEQEILDIVDSLMFSCASCGWTVDVCDMSTQASNMTDLVCVDCEDES